LVEDAVDRLAAEEPTLGDRLRAARDAVGHVRGVPTRLMLDQLRAVDREKAIADRVGRLTPQEMVEVNRLLRAVLDVL
jgi:mRNA-degrading endonuclease toxin of MazEF toxin-antitoxin module